MPPVQRGSKRASSRKPIAKKNRKAIKPAPKPQLHQLTAEEIVVDNVQSFELVRCVITAAISSVAWVRDLFHEDCFEPRMYDYNNPDPSYEAFKNGQHGFVTAKAQSDRFFHWKILVPNVDKGVDKLLSWLENGVAEALRLKYLSEIQLRIYNSNVAPENLVEAYVIEVTYDNSIASLQVNLQSRGKRESSGDKTVMLADAKKNISKLVNNVIVQAQVLTDNILELPKEGVLDMNLGYNNTCPPGWIAPGFKQCLNPDFSLNGKSRVESAETGYHNVRITLFNKNPTNSVESISMEPEKEIAGSDHTQISQSSATDGGETQESGLQAFRNIGTTRILYGETQDTQQLSSEKKASPDPQCRFYTQPVFDRIIEARRRRVEAQNCSVNDNDIHLDGVECECEAPGFSSTPKLQCDICAHYKHFECYGYLETGRPPIDFVCYSCLRSFDEDIVTKMQNICVKRRILRFLREGGNASELGEVLHKEELSVLRILGELSNEGCITLNKRKLKGKGKSGEEPAVRFMGNGEYFQPSRDIQHLLTLPNVPNDHAQADEWPIPDSSQITNQRAAIASSQDAPGKLTPDASPATSQKRISSADTRTAKRVKSSGLNHSANSPWIYRRT